MAELHSDSLSLIRNGNTLLDKATLTLKAGEFAVLLGANGAGKTSLVKAALGLKAANTGWSKISGYDVRKVDAVKRARLCAYLPQARQIAWPNIVRDVVALGRFAYGASMRKLSEDDQVAVNRAIEECDLLHLADRYCDTLSGGELARVHFARAVASEAPLLVADEPTSALDLRHQFQVMDLIGAYVENGGGALVILHDVALAARYASRLIWMKEGKIVADGSPQDTLSADLIADIYRVKAHISDTDISIEKAL